VIIINVFKLLDRSKKKDSCLVIYSLLNRIPLFFFGSDPPIIDNLLNELSTIIPFRKELTFYNDFISMEEYEEIIQNENIDFNIQRTQICCPCSYFAQLLKTFHSYKSFIIGVNLERQEDCFDFIDSHLKSMIKKYVCILLYSNKIKIISKGINRKSLDLSFEAKILQKVSEDTEKAISKMKRVLNDKVRLKNIDRDLANTLLDFEVEINELKMNIIKKEIQNFYSGSKRTFFILTRLKLLNGIGINSSIGSRTLLETIDYLDVSINRILSFIESEWGENFNDLIEQDKNAYIGDKIQSLWG
jgi:hypothetical protein